jgi:uncharacterized protein (TIGR00255 family)
MIRSMTGFGQAGRTVSEYKIQVDIKSVNHRYQETMIRMPREWLHLEDILKKLIQSKVNRGRLDVYINIERNVASAVQAEINWPLAEGYQQAADQLRNHLNLEHGLTAKDMLLFPDVVTFRDVQSESGEQIEEELKNCVNEALQQLLHMRETEGRHLYADITGRLQVLENNRQEVLQKVPQINEEYCTKLRVRIQELLSDAPFDENRFTMEVAVMAERANIDEELTRLLSHFKQCEQLLESEVPSGRKLDFLIQEMNREVNTIGSKSNHSDLVNRVVSMKAELEKIREQVQNVE